MKTDLDLLGALVDANCRAHSEALGFHYDSRCLEHYAEALERMVEVGVVSKLLGRAREFDGRVRTTCLPEPEQVTRPTTDPRWQMWQEENRILRERVADLEARNRPMPEPIRFDGGAPHAH